MAQSKYCIYSYIKCIVLIKQDLKAPSPPVMKTYLGSIVFETFYGH